MKAIKIGTQLVGEGYPTFVIAEAGLNHNGRFSLAKKLIVEAVKTGADAVKFQTLRADKIVTRKNAFAADFFRKHEFTEKQWKELARLANKVGIMFFSSPFDEQSADLLEKLHVPAYKIASGDLTHIPLLKHVAKKKKPMIVSTGAGYKEEMREAVKAIFSTGNKQLILLHCISNYPTSPQEAHLEIIPFLRKTFHVPAGFSDHTIGIGVSVAAVALGACVIEKHFTLDTAMPGPDHRLSLNPQDFSRMVEAIRQAEVAVQKGFKGKRPDERERMGARRTIVAATHIKKGVKITPAMLKIVRAGNKGLYPKYLGQIVGKVAKRAIESEEPIVKNLFI